MMKITKRSIISGKTHTIDLPVTENELYAYYSGRKLIQDALPMLNADQREFLMTGITPEEWEVAMKEAYEAEEATNTDDAPLLR